MSAFFSEEDSRKIEQAIEQAELNCSGEIRVHVDKYCTKNVLDDAAHWFAKLNMHKTKLRNGVLFYIAYKSRKFAVLGDMGINSKVPENFWNDVTKVMSEDFAKNDFVGGLQKGIEMCGQKLKDFFPYQDDDVNELPNEISYGENDSSNKNF